MANSGLKLAFLPRKVTIFILALFTVLSTNIAFSNQGLSIGETIPNPEFIVHDYFNPVRDEKVRMHDYKDGKNMLIAFMPDISDKNSYSKVMMTAFDTYFAEGLAFVNGFTYMVPPGEIKVLIVSNNSQDEMEDYMRDLNLDFDMVSDKELDMAHFFGVQNWNSSNDPAMVYIVNSDNKITYASYDYKGEGEKLKSIQKEFFALYNIEEDLTEAIEYAPLMPGDKARDFDFDYIGSSASNLNEVNGRKLSDYIGKKNVLIAFYPAAFSMSCAMEVSNFNTYAEDQTIKSVMNSNLTGKEDLEILMISQSNYLILEKWKKELALEHIKLVSDNSGDISMKYNSYNMLGYNKRTMFLIDKQGNVAYIDWDYQVDSDFNQVKEQISSLN